MAMDFVAIDFETANSFRGSPCAVGLTKVIDGEIVNNHSMIMRPPTGVDYFDDWNISIHGITPEMVHSAPRFSDAWVSISDFIDGLPIVAHNAAFDTGVIRSALQESGLPIGNITYACTMVIGRRIFQLPSYGLSFLAEAAGVDWDESRHHEAGFDALIAARIMINLACLKTVESLESLCASVGVRLGHITDEQWRGCTVSQHHGNATEIQVNEDANEAHPLYGKVVVFTGALYSMSRHEAWQRIAALGAIPAENVTAKTNFLVIGEQDPAKLRPGHNQSSKFQKAATLRGKGQEIEVITERDFLTVLEDVSTV